MRKTRPRFWREVYLASLRTAATTPKKISAHAAELATAAADALVAYEETTSASALALDPNVRERTLELETEHPVAPGSTGWAYWIADGFFAPQAIKALTGMVGSMEAGNIAVYLKGDSLVRSVTVAPGVQVRVHMKNDTDTRQRLEVSITGLFEGHGNNELREV